MGILNFVAGVFALISPVAATGFILLFASMTLFIGGVATMTGVCFGEAGMRSQMLVLGIAEVILALLLWMRPFESLMVITILIAAAYMVNGAFCCGLACQNRDSPTWGWTLISGVCGILFSVLVMSAFPMSSLYTVGIIVGVNLINIGMARIAIAHKGRTLAVGQIEGGTSIGSYV